MIEVGEYVRLKNGKIIKFERFGIYRTHPYDKENKTYTTQEHKAIISTEKNHYKYDNIVKHSKNIIDLIEVGDYVNGSYIDQVPQNPEYKLVWHLSHYGDDDEAFKEEDIESIVTKEQFAQAEYKIEKGKEE